MKKQDIVITILLFIAGILLGIILSIVLKITKPPKCEIVECETTSEVSSTKIENVDIKKYNGQDYYIITDDYKGEYDLQKIDLSDHYNKSEEELFDILKLYNTKDILSYYDYVLYCKKWNIEQKYKDYNKNYLLISYAAYGSPILEARLANVVINNNKATAYVWDYYEGVTANISAYFIAIPLNKNIRKSEVVSTINQEEYDRIISNYQYEPVEKKPIIYIYPKEKMDVEIKLGNYEKLLVSYPKYKDSWKVTALPDGTLIDKNNKTYYGLYWEGKKENVSIQEDGFVVEGKNIEIFLKEKLSYLGLNDKEINEFIIYWMPKLVNNKYNYIRFETKEEIDDYMPLEIIPKPDTLIRIVMDYKVLDKKITVKTQQLNKMSRKGYTVVEWGGTEIE